MRTLPAIPLGKGCRCDPDYVRSVIAEFPAEEREAMVGDDGLIRVDCAFCSSSFAIEPAELELTYLIIQDFTGRAKWRVMTRWKQLLILAAPAAALVLAAAPPGRRRWPQVSGGMWEVSGIPKSKPPLRECIADSMMLAQIEHRAKKCSRTVISDGELQTVIEYKCGGGGFGRSKVTVITPRSLQHRDPGDLGRFPVRLSSSRRIASATAAAARPATRVH